MVVPTIGIRIRFFLASSTPLRIDSGTSPALPRPTPTWPAPSPTTTIALKLKRRPPLTTFATRLIWTTRSSSVSLLGSMRATGCSFRPEVEAGLAGAVGERLDPAGRVVDHLGIDVVEAAEDREARARLRPRDAETDPVVALVARRGAAGDLGHRARS